MGNAQRRGDGRGGIRENMYKGEGILRKAEK